MSGEEYKKRINKMLGQFHDEELLRRIYLMIVAIIKGRP